MFPPVHRGLVLVFSCASERNRMCEWSQFQLLFEQVRCQASVEADQKYPTEDPQLQFEQAVARPRRV